MCKTSPCVAEYCTSSRKPEVQAFSAVPKDPQEAVRERRLAARAPPPGSYTLPSFFDDVDRQRQESLAGSGRHRPRTQWKNQWKTMFRAIHASQTAKARTATIANSKETEQSIAGTDPLAEHGQQEFASAEDLFRQGFGAPAVIGVGSTVKVHTDKRRVLALCRKAGIDTENDGLRIKSLGKEGRVIKVDRDDNTAKVTVKDVGDVWLPAEAVDAAGGMGLDSFMFTSPFVNTPFGGAGAWATNLMSTRNVDRQNGSGSVIRAQQKTVQQRMATPPLPLEHWRTHPQEATAAISKMSRQGRVDEAMSAVELMVQSHVEANTFHYNAVLSGCKREGRWAFALGLLSKLPLLLLDPSIVTYNSVISACAEDSAWQVALDLLQTCSADRHLLPTPVTFNAAISACARGRESMRAMSLLGTMEGQSLQRDQVSFGTAITALEGDSWQQAIHLLDLMTDELVSPDVITYSAAITVCGSKSQWRQALQVLAGMHEAWTVPNQITYGAAISACERGHEWQHAMELLATMYSQKFVPNQIVSSAAISACEKASKWQAALALSVGMTVSKLELDIISCNPVIAACANGGQWQLALQLLADMNATASLCPDCFSYTAAITACSRTSQWQRALQLWDDMSRVGTEASSISWNAVISACEKGGQWELALCALEAMVAECPPEETTFGAAICACARGSRWQSAIMLLGDCEERQLQPSVISYSAAISACEDAAEWQPALQMLSRMLEDMTTPNLVTYSSVISACERGLQWQLALELLRDMARLKLTPDAVTCSSAISACEQGGLWHVAVRLLADIKIFAALPTHGSTAAAISACQSQGRWQMVSNLLLDTSTPAGAVTNSFLADSFNIDFTGAEISGSDLSHLSWRLARTTRHFASSPTMVKQMSTSLSQLVMSEASSDIELSELCSVMWSLASMSATDALSGLVKSAKGRLENGEGRLLKPASLANLAWALSIADSESAVLLAVQRELIRRLPELSNSQSYRWQMEFVDATLTILWASSFADSSAGPAKLSARSSLGKLGARLDLTAGKKLLPAVAGSRVGLSGASSRMEPFIKKAVADILVVFKPPGWEVDLSSQEQSREKGRLSEFIRAMFYHSHGRPAVLLDASKQHGFLHRLDVPSSGLLLVATSHQAYFDLHFQLATAALVRDYAVMSHGWMAPKRREIQAPVHWWDSPALADAPSAVLPSGRASHSFCKVIAHLVKAGVALNFMAIRIGTGRRHQIRAHTAHIGHALIMDGKYSSSAECAESQTWCPRNFLHRYRLAFETQGKKLEVTERLPSDLSTAMAETRSLRAAMDMRSWTEGFELQAWHRCPVLERKGADPAKHGACAFTPE
ncbi:unnamed protein product [Symbiodinium sp. CCMP2592]|nr:unnamed protein product [Symbiodinium sp. CCMP2592]